MSAPSDSTVDNAALLASLLNLSVPYYLSPALAAAAKRTKERLVIVLYSPLFASDADVDSPEQSHTGLWNEVQKLLTFVYVQTTKIAQDLDNPLLQVDVLLKGREDSLPEAVGSHVDVVFRIKGESLLDNVPLPKEWSSAPVEHLAINGGPDRSLTVAMSNEFPSLYRVVAVGGTFDHLHAGHKILLSMTAWIAKEKIIVGVTDDALLQKKANANVLQPISTRIQKVHDFLSMFKPGLEYSIVPIQDVYGPTGWDHDVQGLVVSKETVPGSEAIATHRAAENLPPLQTFVIDVISPTSTNLAHEDAELLKQTKMSSTFIREWIVKNKK